jgi:hypothetical protein
MSLPINSSLELQFLNGSNDYSANMCGLNPSKLKVAFNDNGRMNPFCNEDRTHANPTSSCNTTAINAATTAICAYPYVGPLSIKNNGNFCEDGYEPSIWTNPLLSGINYANTALANPGNFITKIDNSTSTSTSDISQTTSSSNPVTRTNDSGKPVWCVKRVKKVNGTWA